MTARIYLQSVDLLVCEVAVHVAVRDAVALAYTLSLGVREFVDDCNLLNKCHH